MFDCLLSRHIYTSKSIKASPAFRVEGHVGKATALLAWILGQE